MTLWAGRMGSGPAAELLAYTESIGFDKALVADDVAGSIAHVKGLGAAGILRPDEVATLIDTLGAVEGEISEGRFQFLDSDEDVHTAVERRVTELCGDVGAKLHTGRSRNDQVATTLRLYTRRRILEIATSLVELESVLLERAVDAKESYLPGYTHLQRAQPVLLAHVLLAHGWALSRDVDRLLATVERLDISPLGAGALAGSSLALDPVFTAKELGFGAPFENSLDAVSDRDYVAEALFDLALLGVHLSRLGEEIVLYSSEEFGFYKLADAWSTGSSMLPQKKNADIAELARGKAGRLIGNLTGLLVVLKGLPLAYNRDLQEDKEPLFDSLRQVELAIPALCGLIASLVFDTKAMAAAADAPVLMATDLAEWLVARGMPFRRAHGLVGSLVREALESGASLEQLAGQHPDLGPETGALFSPGASVRRRQTRGGGGIAAVAVQLERFKEQLAKDKSRLVRFPGGS